MWHRILDASHEKSRVHHTIYLSIHVVNTTAENVSTDINQLLLNSSDLQFKAIKINKNIVVAFTCD